MLGRGAAGCGGLAVVASGLVRGEEEGEKRIKCQWFDKRLGPAGLDCNGCPAARRAEILWTVVSAGHSTHRACRTQEDPVDHS